MLRAIPAAILPAIVVFALVASAGITPANAASRTTATAAGQYTVTTRNVPRKGRRIVRPDPYYTYYGAPAYMYSRSAARRKPPPLNAQIAPFLSVYRFSGPRLYGWPYGFYGPGWGLGWGVGWGWGPAWCWSEEIPLYTLAGVQAGSGPVGICR